VAYIALFLALAGGAVAAGTIGSGDVVNNSLKSADLKTNKGVRGSDVRNGSLGGSDVRNGSLRGANVANDSLTGTDANEASLAVGQITSQLGGNVDFFLPMGAPSPFANNTYTQGANESNVLIAGGKVTFDASCTQPRSATLHLFLDDPTLAIENVAGTTQVSDTGTGAVTRNFTFSPVAGGKSLSPARTGVPVDRTFYAYGTASCSAGAGVTLDSLGIDVVAQR
jgi:hypothetical protein